MHEKNPSENASSADNQQERPPTLGINDPEKSPLSGATYESMAERASRLLINKVRIRRIMEKHGEVAMEDLMQRIDGWYKEYEGK